MSTLSPDPVVQGFDLLINILDRYSGQELEDLADGTYETDSHVIHQYRDCEVTIRECRMG